jgi:hypothetical protein
MFGPLLHCGWEALGNDLAEHQQDFPAPGRGEARPNWDQWPTTPRWLRARGGTVKRRMSDMVALQAIGRAVRGAVTGTTSRVAAVPSH